MAKRNSNSKVTLTCQVCGKQFSTYKCWIERGKGAKQAGLCCSRYCFNKTKIMDFHERFQKNIGQPSETGCLPWLGIKSKDGYGRIYTGALHGRKLVNAHRIAYELKHGPIPDGLIVCHGCDSPSCVNVDHLFLGTFADNSSDMVDKKRQACGSRNGRAKLDDEKVIAIRSLYEKGNTSQQKIADMYGVTQYVISRVVRRLYWKHI